MNESRRQYHHYRRWRWFLWMIIIVSTLLIGNHWWYQHNHQRPSSHQYPIMGISLTQNDGSFDFQKLKKAGVDFVYIRSTSGASYSDDNFEINYTSAQGSLIQIGVYHCFSFSSSPQAQAQYFISQTGNQIGNLPIAIYVDYYGQYAQKPPVLKQARQHLAELITLIQNYYQRPCIIWGKTSVVDQLAGNLPNKKWLIQNKPPHNKQFQFWEYCSNGYFNRNKIDAPLPLSVFNGSRKQWHNLLRYN